MRYEFHPEALEEYRQAALWYAEREQRAALEFVASVEDAIARMVAAPKRWRLVDEDVRRCLTRIFPFGILYTIEETTSYSLLPSCTSAESRVIGNHESKNVSTFL
jgi:toxin ParE1/3/4